MEPKKFFFKDDGTIPNNKLPLLVYKNAFDKRANEGAAWLEDTFALNNWKNSWRNGVFDYHHYHSISHEVLGVYSGSALLHLGGEKGEKIRVEAGDVIVIPAGVGHKKLESDSDFGIVGAYPNGSDYDINTGREGERPKADKNIAALPIPKNDPLQGEKQGLTKIWAGV
ncbi:cupin domain-containing protein [Zunongwangia sp. F363]|uniref:Cupin domain-containing protein n=1 Tax=Autumnicola tepida TaxID=3075595 RepID=A0ABU3CBW8_9FLAO|nr:cupin domain-containing protein [Zunongwangia sp. F363]MDT0643838.1 cupin domain-containing protein [Zunongwangia sp. F363]